MAYELHGDTITLPTGDDQTAGQYKYVKLNSSGQVIAIAATTDQPFGILQDNAATSAAGNMVPVMMYGVSKVQADAALSIGNRVGTSVDGQAAPYVVGTDTTKYVNGVVLTAATVAAGLATIAFDCLGAGRGA